VIITSTPGHRALDNLFSFWGDFFWEAAHSGYSFGRTLACSQRAPKTVISEFPDDRKRNSDLSQQTFCLAQVKVEK
jgi:hypothetical protein